MSTKPDYLGQRDKPYETDMVYDFAFMSDEEARDDTVDSFWFRVGDILDFREQSDVNDYLIDHELPLRPKEQAKFANKTLFKLREVVHDSMIINYFLEKDESLDKVLNIFIRVNSGGTILSYSDLLLSIATAQWKHRDAREEITSFVHELNNMGDGFRFDKDLVLKGGLVLADFTDIAFKVDNFNKNNMLKIEEQWDDIEKAVRGAVSLVASLGYNRDTLTANYAIIPLAYYLKMKGIPPNFNTSGRYSEDRQAIHRWLILSLVKRVFGGSPDTVLRPIRDILRDDSSSFPLETIVEKLKGSNKSIVCTHDDVDNMLYHRYGQGYTFSILALLFPTLDFRNKFHIDHIHPRSVFTRARLRKRGIPEADIDICIDNVDRLANLQLLEGVPNQEKSATDFCDWLEANHHSKQSKSDYIRRHFIPDVDLTLTNFLDFVEQRNSMIRSEFCRILGL